MNNAFAPRADGPQRAYRGAAHLAVTPSPDAPPAAAAGHSLPGRPTRVQAGQ